MQIGKLDPLFHTFFETIAYIVGFYLYSKAKKSKDTITDSQRNSVTAGCILGAALGSKLIVWLENPSLGWQAFFAGKGIVGALIGGWLGTEITKKIVGIQRSTGDILVIPLIMAIIIGQIGCFVTGFYDQTYGIATNLPIAMDFGDGILRHPTQLYEIAFLIILLGATFLLEKKKLNEGLLFKIFFISYLLFRFCIQFIKPTPRIYFGLDIIQILSIMVCIYYCCGIFNKKWI
jgi:prolipoprotein diacylglyceryltransferase